MKTKHSRLPLIIAAITFITLTTNLYSQVTVGSDIAPTRAALLDLKMQQSATIPSVLDDANITSTTGGLLLPRVKLQSLNNLEPFIPANDQDWISNTDNIKERLAGLMVYNLTSSGDAIYPAVYTWDGAKWTTSQINEVVALTVASQPQAFTFYELGTETVQSLSFSVNGGKGDLTYQWYQITGTNVHIRVKTPIGTAPAITNPSSATESSFTPSGVKKGDTNIAGNCGFYRFYCEVTDEANQKLTSDIAEVAVGCGAKNNAGEWLSFMCFNLGAENKISINTQKNRELIFINDSSNNRHYHVDGEDALYGDLFQWGRIADGHQKRPTTALETDTVWYSSSITISSGNKCSSTTAQRPLDQVQYGERWYGKFIVSPESPFNWTPAAENVANQLWRTSSAAIYEDPCSRYNPSDGALLNSWHHGTNNSTTGSDGACTFPDAGWRLPNQSEWGELYKGGILAGTSDVATANTWSFVAPSRTTIHNTPTQYQYNRAGGFQVMPDGITPTLFLPTNGFRNYTNGLLYYPGTNGFYWSNSITGTNAYILTFYNGYVNPNSSRNRAYGFGIRCIKNT
jgi:uncharacterized protein (TIGR02145 family)